MRLFLAAFFIAYLTVPDSHAAATDVADRRGIDLKSPDVVNVIDSHTSSILGDVKSAYSSAATILPPSLRSQVGAVLPSEAVATRENRASSNIAMHVAVLYGAVSATAGWIMLS
jgi:hypothetical protein